MGRQLILDKLKILLRMSRKILFGLNRPSFNLNYDFCVVVLSKKKYAWTFCERGKGRGSGRDHSRGEWGRASGGAELGTVLGGGRRDGTGLFCPVKQTMPVLGSIFP